MISLVVSNLLQVLHSSQMKVLSDKTLFPDKKILNVPDDKSITVTLEQIVLEERPNKLRRE